MYRTLIGNLRLWTVIPNLSSRNNLRTETGRNKNETESLIGFYKFSVTVVEISSIKAKEDELMSLRDSEENIVRMLERTKQNVMNEAKFAGTRYCARLEDRLLVDVKRVNNWCDKEYAVKYLEETLRTYLGEDFSIVIEFESLSWGHVIDLYVGWCNEEDE